MLYFVHNTMLLRGLKDIEVLYGWQSVIAVKWTARWLPAHGGLSQWSFLLSVQCPVFGFCKSKAIRQWDLFLLSHWTGKFSNICTAWRHYPVKYRSLFVKDIEFWHTQFNKWSNQLVLVKLWMVKLEHSLY